MCFAWSHDQEAEEWQITHISVTGFTAPPSLKHWNQASAPNTTQATPVGFDQCIH